MACIVLQAIISVVASRFPIFFLAGTRSFGGSLLFSLLSQLCTLGTLPFFISLYRSKRFADIMDSDEPSAPSNKEDERWLNHLLARILFIGGVCLAWFAVSLFDRSLGGAYLVIYGIAYTLGIGGLLLLVEAFRLFLKKCPYKAWSNISLIVVLSGLLGAMM